MSDAPAAVSDNPANPAPETPATPAATPAPTLAATPPTEPAASADPAIATPAATPPDWRAQMAGEDKDAVARLGRFADPSQVWKSYRALEQRISSGELKKTLPDNATPEETVQWRKENGLPENEKGYVDAIKLPDGLVIGDMDKPIVDEFAKQALAKNWSPAQFNDAVAFYYDNIDKQRAMMETADAEFRRSAEDALRNDWQGPDYRRNLTAVNNLIATFPEGVGADLLAARMPNGRLVGDNPALIKALANLALELNPTATLLPAGTADPMKGVEGRLAELKGWMASPKGSENWNKYWKQGGDAEYRELLSAQDKLKSRAA
jgi:hypothetical protein